MIPPPMILIDNIIPISGLKNEVPIPTSMLTVANPIALPIKTSIPQLSLAAQIVMKI